MPADTTQDWVNVYREAALVVGVQNPSCSVAHPDAVHSIKSNAASLATLQPSGN